MKRSAAAIHAFLASLPLAVADANGQDKLPTPAAAYEALLKEVQNAPDDYANATTPEARRELSARLTTLPQRLLDLAEANPHDPVAVDALMQTVAWANSSAFPAGGQDTPGERALAILVRDHAESPKLGKLCQQVLFGFHGSIETFLRTILEKNPHREVQALACLSLAQFLNNRQQRLDVLRDQDNPDLAARYHQIFGKDFVEQLQAQDRAAVEREIDTLFARAAEEYPDVEIPVTYYGSGGKVGEKAAAELFQIRYLAVGKVAPDIEGEDQDGVQFKLSEYRGKVVLIDIWYHL